ncbi:unnamed protein product [Prunus armeniaca]|uniref:Ubiquitin-like domain-containing protein n=1 Tax=Prunus armeniaca TaxID=36596 RepID=A0A6J5U1L6_PRUAR|nr:hypothetical protein GBA52_007319 [Prunus armeniaca]CAB4270230.1 unnamed protein product [Prunus armeniaca]
MEDTKSKTYNLFVTLLEGKTLTLKFTAPDVSAASIKNRLLEITKIPLHHQRLVTGTRQLKDDSVISCSSDVPYFPTVHLLLRLVGGKGGFGSLLRGAATKAGQKKTSNFDACRDMSGRRLRHVNAEKKLEEWRAEEEERRLEKNAEDFLKNLAKKGKKGTGDAEAEKYVAKYRAESERCVSEVLDSVKEAVSGKRKGPARKAVAQSKRMKIWMGKRKMGESDNDTEDDDSDNEDKKEKSVVLNSGNNSDSSKDAEGSLDSVTGRKQDGEISGGGSGESGSEEEKEIVVQGTQGQESLHSEKNDVVESVIHEEKIVRSASTPYSEPDAVLKPEAVQEEKMDCNGPDMGNLDVVDQSQKVSSSGDVKGNETTSIVSEANGSSESNPRVQEETVASGDTAEIEKPLNFDEFNSAAEMEVLGLERLKSELQARGLKCGGTMQERAARLFMLKSTPIEKIPKKLLAKK